MKNKYLLQLLSFCPIRLEARAPQGGIMFRWEDSIEGGLKYSLRVWSGLVLDTLINLQIL